MGHASADGVLWPRVGERQPRPRDRIGYAPVRSFAVPSVCRGRGTATIRVLHVGAWPHGPDATKPRRLRPQVRREALDTAVADVLLLAGRQRWLHRRPAADHEARVREERRWRGPRVRGHRREARLLPLQERESRLGRQLLLSWRWLQVRLRLVRLLRLTMLAATK